jgi:enoyl-CoA hydratase
MASDLLHVARHDNIAILTLNRPDRRNALNTELRDAIREALTGIEEDDATSVATITGNGSVFCAGFDLKEFEGGRMQEIFAGESSVKYHEKLRMFSKPLIGAINGPAMAGGFDIAVFCDLRIASSAASFGHPEIKFGSGVMFGPLADLVGEALARDLCFTGRTIDADAAYRHGLVSRVVSAADLAAETLSLARTVAEAPLPALMRVKAAVIDRRR